ncbi:MAG: hypothetical protein PVJ76_18515, partial [Gemmatimonadota bacterium]
MPSGSLGRGPIDSGSASTPAREKGRWHIAALFGLALAGALALSLYVMGLTEIAKHAENADFALFHHSAQKLVEGRSIYEPLPAGHPLATQQHSPTGLDRPLPNLNPPFQTFLFSPLARFPTQTAYLIWTSFSLLCGLGAAILIGLKGWGSPRKALTSLLTVDLLLLYFPTLMS